MVRADLDDVESLTAAFSGSHGAFCVTNFWEHFSPEKEIEQARNLAKAAKATDVHHVVWSTIDAAVAKASEPVRTLTLAVPPALSTVKFAVTTVMLLSASSISAVIA